MVAAALKGRARRAADGEVPFEEVVLERGCFKVRVGSCLRNLRARIQAPPCSSGMMDAAAQAEGGGSGGTHLASLAHDSLDGRIVGVHV